MVEISRAEGGMSMQIIVSRRFAASAESVWALVGDFAGCAKWCLVGHCEVTGEGLGAVRTVTGSGGGIADDLHLKQTLTEHDEEARVIGYSMNDSEALPWTDYRARITVLSQAPGCEVIWECSVAPLAAESIVQRSVRETYEKALQNLSSLVEPA